MSRRPTRVPRSRPRPSVWVVGIAGAGIAALALGGGVAAATTAAPPTVKSLSVRPASLPAIGGTITVRIRSGDATSCVVASSPAIAGLPKTLDCATGSVSDAVRVGANLTFATRRFEIFARAANGSGSSPVAHTWVTQPAVHRTPVIVTCTGEADIKPTVYVLACADANAYWKGVTWTTWAHTALGHGTLVLNDCKPACFDGHLHSYAMTVLLNRYMIVAPYGPLYCMATIRYTVRGKHETYVAVLPT
jgi:hypothetical protein